LITEAFSQGLNFFDNADMYAEGRAEVVMGKAIKQLPREELVISSKVFWPTWKGPNGRGLSRKHITESIHASLKRLGTEYVDLYFCHRYDPDTPVEEVVRTMSDLIHQGKILYWGTSEWEASQVMQAYGVAREYGLIPPTMDQPQYNLFHRKRVEDELMPVTRELGIGLTTFSPLYYGILSGKYNDGIPQGSRASMDDYSWIKERITPQRIEIVRQLTLVANQSYRQALFPVMAYSPMNGGSYQEFALYNPEYAAISNAVVGMKANEKKRVVLPTSGTMTTLLSPEDLEKTQIDIKSLEVGDSLLLGVSENPESMAGNTSAVSYIRLAQVVQVSDAGVVVDFGYPSADVTVVQFSHQ
jgi:aryl-alcohol dehydrogenase-like predicted oxidoreductase